jgi:CHAD domain-containing protein/CYTH domain-containing protein
MRVSRLGVAASMDCNDALPDVASAPCAPEIGAGLRVLRLSAPGCPLPAFRSWLSIPDPLFPIPYVPARVDTLRESTDRAVRLVALGHLADAAAAHERLVDEADDEALHDFRVALRRLRSWERAFRPYLRDDLAKKLRRRLRNLASDTGASRDLEVHLAWLTSQRRSLGRRQRAGLNWLMAELEARKSDADAVLERDVQDRFDRLHDKLARSLGSYREQLRLRRDGSAVPLPAFGDALAPRVRNLARDLQEHLSHVTSERDEREAHEARINAKRLRYLLEPVVKIVPGAGDIVDQLKSLQDILGDLHDAQVFGDEITTLALDATPEPAPNADRQAAAASTRAREGRPALGSKPDDGAPAAAAQPDAPPVSGAADVPTMQTTAPPDQTSVAVAAPNADIEPGVTAIMEHLEHRASAAFALFAAQWAGEKSAPFFRDVEAVADRIGAAAHDGMEIERKYLLRFVPEIARDGRRLDIAQGYVPGSKLHERIRRVSVHHGSGRKEVRFYRTVKLGEGVARTELEEETTEAIFLTMWPLTKRHRLRKRRFEVDVDGQTWEIDEFRNRDLVLAEIELDSEDEQVTFPDWLEPAVQREVTGEPEFQNINLAR